METSMKGKRMDLALLLAQFIKIRRRMRRWFLLGYGDIEHSNGGAYDGDNGVYSRPSESGYHWKCDEATQESFLNI